MKSRDLIILFLVLMTAGSCTDFFMPSSPDDTPGNNFETLWLGFDKYYSFFTHKNIDWDQIYRQYRPRVTDQTSDEELFAIFSSMLSIFKDGHVTLHSSLGTYSYDGWWKNYPLNFDRDIILTCYLKGLYQNAGGVFTYGRLTGEIGYIHISSFASRERCYLEIDRILEELQTMKGLVVDVRGNGGGSTVNSDRIASRFADQKRLYQYIRWRNGPGHDDFTEMEEVYIEPEGQQRFTRPVALLTNRGVFSTAEAFVLAMRVFPRVTVIGDYTGGGSGNPIYRELPNGWVYRLSRWQSFTPSREIYEEIGLRPDIRLDISGEDQAAGRDTILDRAIAILEE